MAQKLRKSLDFLLDKYETLLYLKKRQSFQKGVP